MFYKPNEYHKNIESINFKKLYKKDAIICFDLDNTLDIPDSGKIIDEKTEKFLRDLENQGYKVIIFSNNHEERVNVFANNKFECYHSVKKPFQKNYKKILKNNKNVIFVGDKIVTDIIGGNLYGGYTILVDPISPAKKQWYTKIMVYSENIFRTITRFKKGDYFE